MSQPPPQISFSCTDIIFFLNNYILWLNDIIKRKSKYAFFKRNNSYVYLWDWNSMAIEKPRIPLSTSS